MPFGEVLGRQMGSFEKTLYITGIISALIFGGAMPAFCFLFGDMVDNVGGQQESPMAGFDKIEETAFLMLYVGCGVMLFSFF